MDNGGIWPGDERYFQNIRETALQDTIEQLTKELAEARAEIEKQDTLLEKCLSLLKQQKERDE
jgi:uncharacterized coiled-coil protein SlyX